MPAPEQITNPLTRVVVWEADGNGNTKQARGLNLAILTTPDPTPAGYVQLFASASGALSVVTPQGSNIPLPVPDPSGNVTITGTLTVSPGGVIQLGADVNIYRASADVLQTDDYMVIPNGQSNGTFSAFGGQPNALTAGTAGGGVSIKEGTNARMGVATLVGGTVVVNNTSVTANTRIFLTCETPGGTPGFLRVSARTASTSFTILSSSGTDTSVVGWVMFEPA